MTDKICYNGELISPENMGGKAWRELSDLRDKSYIQQYIRTYNYKPVLLEEHLKDIDRIAQDMYGKAFKYSEKVLQTDTDIVKLLKANRYHNKSNLLIFKAFSKGGYIIECKEQLLYDEYVEWHTRPMAEIFPCEYLFMGYPTGVSQMICSYASDFAKKRGAEIALTANGQGVLTNVNDEPLFVASGNKIIVSPIWEGSAETIMRRFLIEACSEIGMEISEEPISLEIFEECDEAFYASPQGLVNIKGWGDKLFYNIIPGKITGILNSKLGL